MTHLDRSKPRRTSVTLRLSTHTLLHKAIPLFKQRGLNCSEQRLMRECLRVALKLWRGRRNIAERNRKYNARVGPYEIVPWYTTENLRAIAHARCHHAGISLSRLMDFAIVTYLPRVIEYWLRFDYYWRDKADAAAWARKYACRRHFERFVISYETQTERNDGTALKYSEKTTINPWPPPAN